MKGRGSLPASRVSSRSSSLGRTGTPGQMAPSPSTRPSSAVYRSGQAPTPSHAASAHDLRAGALACRADSFRTTGAPSLRRRQASAADSTPPGMMRAPCSPRRASQQAANAGNSARKRSARWPSRRSRFAMSASSTPSTARPSRSNFGVVAMPFDDRPVSNGRIGPACSHHDAWLGHALVDALLATLAVTQETPRDRPSLQLVAHRKPSAPARASHRPTLHEHRLRWLGGLSPATSTSPVKIWPTRVFVLAQTGPGRGQARDCVCPTAAAGPGCSTALLVTRFLRNAITRIANAARLRCWCCICSCRLVCE